MFRQTEPTFVPARPGTDAPTISAQEMARLTGVGRERLRTWERRHGFPLPLRQANKQRRYLAADVPRVAAIARAIEAGVPVAEAITRTETLTAETDGGRLDAALEHCHTPALALTGPSPVRVAWANPDTLGSAASPLVGDELTDAAARFGATGLARLQDLMVDPEAGCTVLELRDWTSEESAMRRALAWRLPPEAASQPTVVLMQLPGAAHDAPVAPRVAAAPAPTDDERWAHALNTATTILQEQQGLVCVQRALGAFATTIGATDAFLATRHGSRLRTATSVRGTLAPRTIDLSPGQRLAEVVLSAHATWLDASAVRAIDAPFATSVLSVPLGASGQRLGAAFLVLPEQPALSPVVMEMLRGFGLSLSLAIQRDRAVSTAAHAAA